MASTVKAAYFGYKAFQAFRLLMGDVTVVAEAVAELLAEGLGEAAIEAVIEQSADHVVDVFQGAKELNESARDFQAFCNQLSEELGRNNPAAKAVIDEAQELYQFFVAIDADGSGTVSRQELQAAFSTMGYNTQVANEQFDFLDTDKDGETRSCFAVWPVYAAAYIGFMLWCVLLGALYLCAQHYILESSRCCC